MTVGICLETINLLTYTSKTSWKMKMQCSVSKQNSKILYFLYSIRLSLPIILILLLEILITTFLLALSIEIIYFKIGKIVSFKEPKFTPMLQNHCQTTQAVEPIQLSLDFQRTRTA